MVFHFCISSLLTEPNQFSFVYYIQFSNACFEMKIQAGVVIKHLPNMPKVLGLFSSMEKGDEEINICSRMIDMWGNNLIVMRILHVPACISILRKTLVNTPLHPHWPVLWEYTGHTHSHVVVRFPSCLRKHSSHQLQSSQPGIHPLANPSAHC